ncbi:MAG: DUF5335 family protein [Cyclobacteriaceae bacterium]|nr:DUF5335 family protein [Cyclobacteriaceae bacterium]
MGSRGKIENEHWQNKLKAFSSTNKGRMATIVALGMTIIENKAFNSVIYDPILKGNDLVLAVDGFVHMVNEPVEMYITQEFNDMVSILEILDQNGMTTFLKLL